MSDWTALVDRRARPRAASARCPSRNTGSPSLVRRRAARRRGRCPSCRRARTRRRAAARPGSSARTSGLMRPSKLRLPDSTDDDDQVVVADRRRDLVGQRTAVADAGRAAVADQVEAELVEVLGQPGPVEVLGHHLRARRERRLDPRLDASGPFCTALRARMPGAEHHRRVRGVRAARDRGDHDAAVVELGLGAVLERHGDSVAADRRPAPRRCRRPARGRRRSGRGSRPGRGREALLDRLVLGVLVGQVALERASGTPAWTRSATRGPAAASGPAMLGTTVDEVELERVGERRLLGVPRRATGPAPWRTPRRASISSCGRPENSQVAQRLGVDREDRAGRAVLGRHVADRRAVGERAAAPGPSP